MAKLGKRSKKLAALVDRAENYSVEDAMDLVKKTASAKFDETVEAAIHLGIDARKSDQNVRGTAVLPRGIGKTVRVAVFATGENADAAREAGADLVGLEELLGDIRNGNLNFDSCIAEPDVMRKVASVGRILGPRGLMPNPKTGTVRTDIGAAVREAKGGKVNFRVDKAGIIHCRIGKVSFDQQALQENFQELVRSLKRMQPAAAKGQYIRKVTLSTTMGPGIKVDALEVTRL